jgi:uncharacterized repeat protein (TIGR01451 family)
LWRKLSKQSFFNGNSYSACVALFLLGSLSAFADDPPPNDDFANATVIVGESGSLTATNADATQESGEPAHAGRSGTRSVWWTWTAPHDAAAYIGTSGSGLKPALAIYTGSSLDALTEVVSNDGDGSDDDTSSVFFDVVANTTYRIAIDGRDEGAAGDIILSWLSDEFIQPGLTFIGTVVDVTGGNALAGDELFYEFSVRNINSFKVSKLSFEITIPNYTQYVDNSFTYPEGGNFSEGSNTLFVEDMEILGYSFGVFTFSVIINDPLNESVAEISAQALIEGQLDGGDPVDQRALSDGDPEQPGAQPTVIRIGALGEPEFGDSSMRAELSIDADANGTFSPLDTVAYTVQVTNTGTGTLAADVTFSDIVPASTTYVSNSVTATVGIITYDAATDSIQWSGPVEAGETGTLSYSVTIDAGAISGQLIGTQGTIEFDSDSDGLNDSSILTDGDLGEAGRQPTIITINGFPDTVALLSGVDVNGATLLPGDTVTYTVSFTNDSAFSIPFVSYTEVLPSSVDIISGSVVLPPGATLVQQSPTLAATDIAIAPQTTVTIEYSVTVDADVLPGQKIISQGTQALDFDDDGIIDKTVLTDADSLTPEAEPTILTVETEVDGLVLKSLSVVDEAMTGPGDLITYTLTIQNDSAFVLSGVELLDPIPVQTTFVPGSIVAPPGAIIVTESPAVAIENINVPALSSVIVSFQVTVNLDVIFGDVVSNQATFSFDLDGDDINETEILTDSDSVTPGAQPTDIALAGGFQGAVLLSVVDANGGNTEPGDVLDYTLTLQNDTGFLIPEAAVQVPMPADSVYVVDSLSAPVGSTVVSESPLLAIEDIALPSHSQSLVRFSVRINTPLASTVTAIVTQGSVLADFDGDGVSDVTQPTDGDTSVEGAQPTSIAITAGPDYRNLSKGAELFVDTGGDGLYSPGDTIRYTITIENEGNQDTPDPEELTDPLPPEITYVADSATATSGTISYSTELNNISWSGAADVGTVIVLTYDATVNTGLVSGTAISNQGTLYYDNTDNPNLSITTDGDLNEPGSQPTLVEVGGVGAGQAFKVGVDVNGNTLVPGDQIAYTISLVNPTGFLIPDATFTDVLPSELTLNSESITVSDANGTINISTANVVTIEDIVLPPNSTVDIGYNATVNLDVLPGRDIVNQGQLFKDNDGDGVLDESILTDGDTTTPGEQPTVLTVDDTVDGDVTMTVSAPDPENVGPGDVLTYTVTFTNNSAFTFNGTEYFNGIPDEVTMNSGSAEIPAGATLVSESPTLEISGITIGAMSSVTITYATTVNTELLVVDVVSNQGVFTVDTDGDGTNETQVETDGDPLIAGAQPTVIGLSEGLSGTAILSVVDVNGSNTEPDDVLEYTLNLSNASGFLIPAASVQVPMPLNTTYIADSLSAPAGSTVISETPLLRIEGIALPAYAQATVRFQTRIDSPIPAGVVIITTQGEVAVDENGDGVYGAPAPTDGNPSLEGDQPTEIALTSGPDFRNTTKTAELLNDANGDGVYSPGDTVRYTIRIVNDGNQETSTPEQLLDPIPAEVGYVFGSKTASTGAIVYDFDLNRIDWNGETNVGVEVTLTYDATIVTDLLSGTVISNQGTLFYTDGSGLSTSITTDADLVAPGSQPTLIEVGGAGAGFAFKSGTDTNGGTLVPGDQIDYTVSLVNPTGFLIPNATFTDNLPPKSPWYPIPSPSSVRPATPSTIPQHPPSSSKTS